MATNITIGCPAQGTGVVCYERCADARKAGESRLCEGTEFDPAQARVEELTLAQFGGLLAAWAAELRDLR